MIRQRKLVTPLKRQAGKTIFRIKRKLSFTKRLIMFFITFLFVFSALSSCSQNPPHSSLEEPIEPLVTGQEPLQGELSLRGRFSVLNPEMKVFALSVSHNGEEILFSSEARTISKLDDEANLLWEIASEGLPVCAAVTEDGSFTAVGTDEGKIYFLREDGHILWQTSFNGGIEHLVLNKNGDKLALSVSEEKKSTLYCLDKWGSLLWQMETDPLQALSFTSGEEICYLEKGESDGIFKVIREGDLLWEKEAQLAAFSAEGGYFVLYNGIELQYYRLGPDGEPSCLWSCRTGSEKEINWLGLTEKGRYLLAYNTFAAGNNNLWVYNHDGLLLWGRRIPSGALLDFSSSGERIVASSWQEYSEDFSKIVVLDNCGNILREMEMASRIEKNALSGDGNILALAGSDGNLFILETPDAGSLAGENGNLEEKNGKSENGEQAKTLYRPVTFERPEGESYINLFFFDEDARNLIPVNRSVKAAPQLFQTAVNELVKGPRSSSGLSRTISKDINIEVEVKEGLVYLDLPAELNRLSGSTQVLGLVDSLVLTLSQFSSVDGIQFLLEGEKISVLSGEGVAVDKVFCPCRLGDKSHIYLPYRSGDCYYLFPRENNGVKDPLDLANAVIRESSAFLPVKPRLREIKVHEKEIILNWEASFTELFPPGGSSKEKALAELFTDALLLTLGENLPPDRLIFQVEGEFWTPPEDYTLSSEISRPFYINPE